MICLIGTILKERYYGIFRAVKEIPIIKKKEVMLMQRLDHPAIPKIVDCVETEEDCYLIMEYIKGQSLEEILCSEKNFSI